MKEGIHPTYGPCEVRCACGHSFTTRSTRPKIQVDICSKCHPFFTGQQKLVDTAGRVERFSKRFASTEGKMVHRTAQKRVVKHVSKIMKKPGILSTTPRKAKLAAAKAAAKTPDKKGSK